MKHKYKPGFYIVNSRANGQALSLCIPLRHVEAE